MAVTKKQHTANKNNARKSTGPVTSIGKAKVSGNAVKHGVLSSKLLLPDENEEHYQQMLDDLNTSLNPSGALELALVEKIAVNLWHQRRLTHAETAEINLQIHPRIIVKEVTEILNCRDRPVTVSEIEGTDQQHSDWYDNIVIEIEKLNSMSISHWSELKDITPTVYEYLLIEATFDDDANDVDSYLNLYVDHLNDYLIWLRDKCDDIDRRRSDVLHIAEIVKIKNHVLRESEEKKFTRYQTTLNNEFHRLINTLLNLKKMQSHFIEGESVTIS